MRPPIERRSEPKCDDKISILCKGTKRWECHYNMEITTIQVWPSKARHVYAHLFSIMIRDVLPPILKTFIVGNGKSFFFNRRLVDSLAWFLQVCMHLWDWSCVIWIAHWKCNRASQRQPMNSTSKWTRTECKWCTGLITRLFPGLVNFVPVVAYHFCLNLSAAFSQPGISLTEKPCTKNALR